MYLILYSKNFILDYQTYDNGLLRISNDCVKDLSFINNFHLVSFFTFIRIFLTNDNVQVLH